MRRSVLTSCGEEALRGIREFYRASWIGMEHHATGEGVTTAQLLCSEANLAEAELATGETPLAALRGTKLDLVSAKCFAGA